MLYAQASLFVSVVPPWKLAPGLLQERLEIVARLAVATRNRAFSEADRAAGDTNWGLACKAHERLMYALTDLSDRAMHPWLTLVREGLYLMPIVDGVPIRIFRGAPDKPSSRHLEAARFEHERQRAASRQMAFDFMGGVAPEEPWYWMMAMETDAAGLVTQVTFFQANDAGETRNPWVCEAAIAPAPAATGKPEALAAPSATEGGKVVELNARARSAARQKTRPTSDARQAELVPIEKAE